MAQRQTNDFVLGMDFGGTKIALGTAALDGRGLRSQRLDTDANNGAAQAIDRALDSARRLISDTADAVGGRCAAVGAVSPGIVGADGVALAPNVPGWEELALPSLLREGLDIERAEVGTDVKAAALAESRWGSLRGADPAVLVSLGTGIAAGIVIGGRVLAGANGAAGEIGYSLRGPGDELGAADGHAPLEEYAGGRAIGERGSRLLGGALTAADVFAYSDPRARSLVDEALAELGVHVANLAIALDPERIALAGGLMASGDVVMAALSRRLRFAVPFPPELVPARFLYDGALRGAIALALDAAGSPAPEAVA
jgi:glucokinase